MVGDTAIANCLASPNSRATADTMVVRRFAGKPIGG